MKKIISLILISCLCFALASCGAATLTGEPTVFMNADKSFSIELPAKETEDKDKASWIINEETGGDILDITDSAETVNIVIQCASKSKMSRVAGDLTQYEKFVTENTFAPYFEGINTKTTHVDVPEHIASYNAYTFTGKKTEGLIIFMDSEKCYYTVFVLAVENGYKANEKVIANSILSIKEIPVYEEPVETEGETPAE